MIYIALLLATFCMIYSTRRGFLDLLFLVMLHLYVGIFLRCIFLSLGENEKYTVGEMFVKNDPSNVYYLVICFFVFFLSFIYFSRRSNTTKSITDSTMIPYVPGKVSVLNVVYFLSYSMHFLSMFVYIGGLGEIFSAFTQRARGAYDYPAYFTLIQDFYVVLTVFMYYISSFDKDKRNSYIVTLMIVMTLFSLVISGGRGNLLQFVLTLLCIGMLKSKTQVFLNARLVLFSMVAVVVLVVGLSNRIVQQSPEIAFSDALSEVNDSLIEKITGTLAIYDHFQLTKIYTDESGYDYGLIYLYNFLKPIPRDVWVDKPLSLDLTIRDYFWGDTLGGIPPGLFGEFYLVGGLFFMLIGTLLFSFFTSKFSNALPNMRRGSILFYLYVIIMPYWFFSLVRLGVDIFFTRSLIVLFFSYLIYKYYSKKIIVR